MQYLTLERIKKKIGQYQRGLLDAERYSPSAILIPLLNPKEGTCAVLFTVRSHRLLTQPGEICFPGGHVSPADAHEKETAVRETCEELGLAPSDVEVWGSLDVLVTPFGQIIYPFAGFLRQPEAIRPNPAEVGEIFTAELHYLLAQAPQYHEITLQVSPPETFPFHKIPRGRNYPWRTAVWPELFYEIHGRTVWGITARILHHFLNIIRQSDDPPGSWRGKVFPGDP
ncbi:NUDIX hydrolase [Thermanaeromonas sp. C210]|uniref:NUDIX hydrolase n=1 Tax=Thermanaeromonas sp. C210 TaxID=2731925 RepID=UPI00155BD833|nr:CoA pyrophosphatase [Thermanaeromonas sp. C210]GFN22533.1 coenzyme A pyrophosphatase [Thermanaeromonas sp. C210]